MTADPTPEFQSALRDALVSGRHPKWQRVEPGTVIPAGQPYAVKPSASMSSGLTWMEYGRGAPHEQKTDERYEWFIDSSWRPPLVLPTEPTWGIAVYDTPGTVAEVGRWYLLGDMLHGRCDWFADRVLDFIPLTDEQVARIEARR